MASKSLIGSMCCVSIDPEQIHSSISFSMTEQISLPVIFSSLQATPSAKSFRFSNRNRFSAQAKSQTLTSHFRQSKTNPKTDTTIAQPTIPHIFRKGRGADPDLFRLSFPATVE